jgi:hypothetical protein
MMYQLKSLIIKHIFGRIEEKYFLKTGTSGNSVSVSKIAEFAEFNVAVGLPLPTDCSSDCVITHLQACC